MSKRNQRKCTGEKREKIMQQLKDKKPSVLRREEYGKAKSDPQKKAALAQGNVTDVHTLKVLQRARLSVI